MQTEFVSHKKVLDLQRDYWNNNDLSFSMGSPSNFTFIVKRI